jgi:hypothetical protein
MVLAKTVTGQGLPPTSRRSARSVGIQRGMDFADGIGL